MNAPPHLLYPLPPAHGAGLGVHLTMDLAGDLFAGPDTTYLDAFDANAPGAYDVDGTKADEFQEAVATYLPAARHATFTPAYAGVRPKLFGPNAGPDAKRDFVIERFHESPDAVHSLGIESPGLTSCLAIAEEIERLI